MSVTFGEPTRVTALEGVSFVARRRARVCWELWGGELAGHRAVEDMLASVEVRWFVVCDARGVPLMDLWQVGAMAFVFRVASTEPFGANDAQELEHAPDTLREVA